MRPIGLIWACVFPTTSPSSCQVTYFPMTVPHSHIHARQYFTAVGDKSTAYVWNPSEVRQTVCLPTPHPRSSTFRAFSFFSSGIMDITSGSGLVHCARFSVSPHNASQFRDFISNKIPSIMCELTRRETRQRYHGRVE